jgi:hypothetical protein
MAGRGSPLPGAAAKMDAADDVVFHQELHDPTTLLVRGVDVRPHGVVQERRSAVQLLDATRRVAYAHGMSTAAADHSEKGGVHRRQLPRRVSAAAPQRVSCRSAGGAAAPRVSCRAA